jgi:hypothetical protein
MEELDSAILVKVQDTKNYKPPSFTILEKFYLELDFASVFNLWA